MNRGPRQECAHSGSASSAGTFEQGGNAWELNEAIIGSYRGLRGGSDGSLPDILAASSRSDRYPPLDNAGSVGFRVASVPEPSTALLVACGLVGLAVRRKRG